jgi:hypothetical protein
VTGSSAPDGGGTARRKGKKDGTTEVSASHWDGAPHLNGNGDKALRALVARDHGANQILMMRKARKNYRSDVCENECEGDVSEDLVRSFYGLSGVLAEDPGKRPRLMFPAINHKAGDDRGGQEEKKENHHSAPARAMPEMALSTKQDEIAYIAECSGSIVDEVREARSCWPDKPPRHSRHDQRADYIARPNMQSEQIILGKIGDGEGHDQGPMEEPHKRVPDIDLLLICTAHRMLLTRGGRLDLEQNQSPEAHPALY